MRMMKVAKCCPNCHEIKEFVVDEDKYYMWVTRQLSIQDAFPEMSHIRREQIITGVCSDQCWDEFVGIPE